MTNNHLNSFFLEKESTILDQRNDYTRKIKVIKLHLIKVRTKADTKWELENTGGKTCREWGWGGRNYESFSGRADSFHSNKT